ncbi:MAG: non-ribosomal peptide synthetase [Acidobacteriota bacterium]
MKAKSAETLVEAVRRSVSTQPDRIAIDDRSAGGDPATAVLTYRQLWDLSSVLAHRLVAAGVRLDEPVALALDGRRRWLPLAMLGVLRAGGCYLPLNPRDPGRRLRSMLRAAGVRHLVTQASPVSWWERLGADTVEIHRIAGEAAAATGERPPQGALPEVPPDALAYVLFTSGSTGEPKGVEISHRAAMHHMRWFLKQFSVSSSDAVLQRTNLTFDASVWEVWVPWVAGGRLVPARPEASRDPVALMQQVAAREITLLQAVPSFWSAILESGHLPRGRALRALFSGGEALPWSLARGLADASGARVHNLYGPTEATIDATHFALADSEAESDGELLDDGVGEEGWVPIGRAIDGVWAHPVDQQLQPVTAGVEGELLLAGPTLARGYRGQPRATALSFRPWAPSADGFTSADGPAAVGSATGLRAYRTGDRCLLGDDDLLRYQGRIDQQLKVRGVRVEAGEIEAAAHLHPAVSRCAALALEEGNGISRLVLFYESPEGVDPAPGQVAAALRQRLPERSRPDRLQPLTALPRLSSGKIDRRALATTGWGSSVTPARSSGPPEGEAERALAAVWCAVLGLDRVGRLEDFMDLGGHSVLVLRLQARIAKRFGVELPVRVLMSQRRLAQMALVVEEAMLDAVTAAT